MPLDDAQKQHMGDLYRDACSRVSGKVLFEQLQDDMSAAKFKARMSAILDARKKDAEDTRDRHGAEAIKLAKLKGDLS